MPDALVAPVDRRALYRDTVVRCGVVLEEVDADDLDAALDAVAIVAAGLRAERARRVLIAESAPRP
jgi:predicted RNA-binding protein associated with RNAse of E/G family